MELLETDAWSHWRKDILRTRICKSYDKPFMLEGALRNHMLNHTGEKRVLGLVTSVKKNLEKPEAWSHWREANLGL